jgi:hypothetical protein
MPHTLTGFPPNKLHDTGPYEAALISIAAENLEAEYLALTGEELSGTEAITVGHRHDTGDSLLTWQPIAEWVTVGDSDAANRHATMVTSSSYVALALAPGRLPILTGETTIDIYPAVRAVNPATGYATVTTLTVRLTLYQIDPTTGVLGAQIGSSFTVTINTGTNGWTVGAAHTVTLADLDADPRDAGWANVAVQIEAKVTVNADQAALQAVHLGWVA